MTSRRFHHLVRAVIEHNGFFLLAHAKGARNTFLPGGHLEPFERITDALRRELLEETVLVVQNFRYLGVLENQFEEKGVRHFELCHVFVVHCPDVQCDQAVQSMEPHLEFLWVKPEEFGRRNLLPVPLRGLLVKQHEFHAWHGESEVWS